MRDPRVVIGPQRMVELDDSVHKTHRKNPHAAVVEEIDPFDGALLALPRSDDRVIAEMRIAVDDPIAKERPPPGFEQADRNRVARLLRGVLESDERLALQPLQREQAPRREALLDSRHAHERPVGEHEPVEPRDLRLALIVEFLAHPRPDLARDFARVDRRADPAAKREQEVELRQVGFDRRSHLGILQLAGERLAFEARRPMHLPERGRRGGLEIEVGEPLAPVRPEFGLHAAAHEGRPHRRRLRLQPHQLAREVRGQRVRDGRQHLRDLHHRALQRAQRRRQRLGVRLPRPAAQSVDADARGKRARIDAESRIARRAGAQAIGFVVTGQRRESCPKGWRPQPRLLARGRSRRYRARAVRLQPTEQSRRGRSIFPTMTRSRAPARISGTTAVARNPPNGVTDGSKPNPTMR